MSHTSLALDRAVINLSHVLQEASQEGISSQVIIITKKPDGKTVVNVFQDGILQVEAVPVANVAMEAVQTARGFAIAVLATRGFRVLRTVIG